MRAAAAVCLLVSVRSQSSGPGEGFILREVYSNDDCSGVASETRGAKVDGLGLGSASCGLLDAPWYAPGLGSALTGLHGTFFTNDDTCTVETHQTDDCSGTSTGTESITEVLGNCVVMAGYTTTSTRLVGCSSAWPNHGSSVPGEGFLVREEYSTGDCSGEATDTLGITVDSYLAGFDSSEGTYSGTASCAGGSTKFFTDDDNCVTEVYSDEDCSGDVISVMSITHHFGNCLPCGPGCSWRIVNCATTSPPSFESGALASISALNVLLASLLIVRVRQQL